MPLIVLLLALVVGCRHGEPAEPDDYAPGGPRSLPLPRRLTYNVADDRTATWLPDGSGILYSSEREDRADHDRCLHLLPAEGGTILRSICPRAPAQDDSTDLYESPALSADGRLAYLRVVSRVGQAKLGNAALVLGGYADPLAATVLRPIPYLAPSGRTHSTVGYVRWAAPGTLVYLGQYLWYQGSTFFPDTFTTGLEVMRVDLGGAVPTVSVVPGTEEASAVSVGEDGALYFTRGGDSRVYRHDLEAGTTTTFFDFGPGHVVRDAEVRGGRLAAVVDGSVLYQYEDAHGRFVQRDEGGDLHVVDLADGRRAAVSTDTVLFRRPRLTPAGTRLLVEVSPWAPVHVGPSPGYTATNHRVDLWLFDLP